MGLSDTITLIQCWPEVRTVTDIMDLAVGAFVVVGAVAAQEVVVAVVAGAEVVGVAAGAGVDVEGVVRFSFDKRKIF